MFSRRAIGIFSRFLRQKALSQEVIEKQDDHLSAATIKKALQMAKVTKKQAEYALKNRVAKITENDVKKVLDKQNEIEEKFKANGPLGRFITDLKLLFSIIKDYAGGVYRGMPWWSISAIAVALFYVLNPLDLIPDFIPVIGYVDDALVVSACLAMVEADLRAYKDWKMANA